MSTIIWIKNGRVIDPANHRDDACADIYIVDEKIVARLDDTQKAAAEVIDATGKVVAPGFIDLNTHLYQPGKTSRETLESGTKSAAAGGWTTVLCLPDEKIAIDNAGTVRLVKELSEKDACVHVLPVGNITKGGEGELLAPIGALKKAGCVAVSDSIGGVANNEIMRRALEYSLMFDLPIFDHCQDSSMSSEGVMHEGEMSLRLGLRGMPRASEDIVVGSDTLLSRLTEARLHIQHVSSFRAVDAIREAKKHNVKISAEVSANHLFLTDVDIGDYNTNMKINPPLRAEKDRKALINGLKDGTIDSIVSDHSPRTPTEKDCEFDYAPFGAINLETTFSVALESLYFTGEMTLPAIIEKMTSSPAKVIGLDAGTLSVGSNADVVVFDLEKTWVPTIENTISKSKNCPFLGKTLRGKVLKTIVQGKIVF